MVHKSFSSFLADFGLSEILYNLTILWFTREFVGTVRFLVAGRSTSSDLLTILRIFITQATYSEDSIQKRQNCNLKLKSSFTKVKQIIREKIIILLLAIQYRHKKQCTNCQEHEEMKCLLKQKLKEQLQRTSQTTRHKGSRTVCLSFREIVQTWTNYLLRTHAMHLLIKRLDQGL